MIPGMLPQWPATRRVYLVRHGDVRYFEPGRVPRHPDEVTLSDKGRAEAHATATLLADVPIDRVATSTLRRTIETAEILLGPKRIKTTSHADLSEIRPASLLAIPPEEMQQSLATAFTSAFSPEDQFLGGETFGDFVDRVTPCINALLAEPDWRHLLVVAHGGVNRAILAHALGAGVASFGHFEQDPACLNILDVDEHGRWLIRLVNYTAYNPNKFGLELTTMQQLYVDYCEFLASARAEEQPTGRE